MTSARDYPHQAFGRVALNCDLGEGFDDVDRKVMPFIDQANIACGGHAGDRNSMQRTVDLALKREVAVGAHPSYPDRDNFGRVSQRYAPEVLLDSLFEQVEALEAVCRAQGARMTYIKAHGALYNDSMKDPSLMRMLLKLAKSFHCALMVQSLPEQQALFDEANELGVTLVREGFADRAYASSGFLLARTVAGSVHANLRDIVQQAIDLAQVPGDESGEKHSLSPLPRQLHVDSICVHGDTDLAIEALQHIYDALR